jgi:aminoglycoside phosphotransferase (APT) family kinase protein
MLESCLPDSLRDATTTITRVATGFSGAGVHRVDTARGSYILKISAADLPVSEWQRRLAIQRSAAEAGLAPAIVHVNDERRAVVTTFIDDRSFSALFGNPATRAHALQLLGRLLREVHALPVPPGTPRSDARAYLVATWQPLVASRLAVPEWVSTLVQRAVDETPADEAVLRVMSHNDVNPTNIVLDGDRVVLIDWDMAGANVPFHDLATAAVFFRMDDAACRQMLGACFGDPVAVLPEEFIALRRLVAVLAGVTFLGLAHRGGHAGDTGASPSSAMTLAECHARQRAGTLDLASSAGQWAFGLALLLQAVG